MPATVAEVFTHRRSSVRREELHRCRIRSSRFNNDRVLESTEGFQGFDHLGHRGSLLSNGDVNTNYVLPFLINDGVDGDCRLSCLPVANDQLALTATDGHHCVNRLESCL